jgi:hypothetical protein
MRSGLPWQSSLRKAGKENSLRQIDQNFLTAVLIRNPITIAFSTHDVDGDAYGFVILHISMPGFADKI